MRFHLREALAAVFAATATMALAQSAALPDLYELRQATQEQKLPLAEQPLFNLAAGSRGPNAEVANAIVQALAADPQMKGSKITVGPEENLVLLTGVTKSIAQVARAMQIATELAGEGKVSNGLASEELFLEPVSVSLSGSQTS